MKLYHGTNEPVGLVAYTEGLLPRQETKKSSNWECASSPHLVYLTNTYAPYFAAAASEKGQRWSVVEVDSEALDSDRMMPDEDFIEQAGCPVPTYLTMRERTKWVRDRIHHFAPMWRLSLEHLGNCSHSGPIPAEAVTKVVMYDPESNPLISSAAVDPQISLLNFKFMSPKYQAMTRWFMGEEVTLEEWMRPFPVDHFDEGTHKSLEQALSRRDGLETWTRS